MGMEEALALASAMAFLLVMVMRELVSLGLIANDPDEVASAARAELEQLLEVLLLLAVETEMTAMACLINLNWQSMLD